MREQLRAGLVTEEAAASALRTTRYMVDQRYSHGGPLSDAAWRLRGAITSYDALYGALAETLSVPLLMTDKRLAGAPGLPREVEVVA
ncbi:putative nucleic acid-binding protein [Saccharopolyspora lacisalsi]|uniref:Putative nucleic acid-binding protein n=1 Tax=Halosaccharopolyspora lacisalsi TaxID=1000566 RepID=A0A839DUP9_9PSEU|nr:hypothetical protein [Halosaccharopolyspora lacisalsi]MBA8825712.1 putative nucleic acid-binding protein [Halosaccharopolyspora lacisalsi]